jgi:hypothetical protein
MAWFTTKKERRELDEIEELAQQNADAIHAVESQHLKRIKDRQAKIEQRLNILKQELDVQTRNNRNA